MKERRNFLAPEVYYKSHPFHSSSNSEQVEVESKAKSKEKPAHHGISFLFRFEGKNAGSVVKLVCRIEVEVVRIRIQ
jgi:hypothetical protein